MKKILSFFLLLFFTLSHAAAIEIDLHLGMGIQMGVAHELVYEGDKRINIEWYPRNANGIGFIFRTSYERIFNLHGITASSNTGIYTGPLIRDEGFSAGMESNQYKFSIGINIPILEGKKEVVL